MRKLVYDPLKSGKRMKIVCFISGSGTNYREIVSRNPENHYLVFTNRPGCAGLTVARENNHEIIELSHVPFLKAAKKRYGSGTIPRNCPERENYEQEVCRLIENKLGNEPDLICLAGYDQWLTDWTVEKYYPRILNVHPGDTSKGYEGLHWIPTARAILAGEKELRSTLFFVDKGEDTGPLLIQSDPVEIVQVLSILEVRGTPGLLERLHKVISFSEANHIYTYEGFAETAGKELCAMLELICTSLQETLKVAGDWKIYPLAVHDFIAPGRVEIDNRTVFIDHEPLPAHGYRLDEHRCY
jgi:phosphoribosylglycinamide formyltransferase-1